jgi:hypothetical protein
LAANENLFLAGVISFEKTVPNCLLSVKLTGWNLAAMSALTEKL